MEKGKDKFSYTTQSKYVRLKNKDLQKGGFVCGYICAREDTMKNKTKGKRTPAEVIVCIVLWLLWAGILYYLFLPALNVHSVGLWFYVMIGVLAPLTLFAAIFSLAEQGDEKKNKKATKLLYVLLTALVVIVVAFLGAFIGGSKMFHAKRYASVMQPQEREFAKDIDASTAVSSIALMDTDSAILLGNREIGGLSDVVSQFDVSDNYAQIDWNGTPKKVSALNYAGFFKYIGNHSEGIPGFVQVDPVGQKAQYVALEKKMKYVPSAYFNEDLHRTLRFSYPDKIFGNAHFEVDEEGNPFYVVTVYQYTIGLFGGKTAAGAIVLDPTDGSSTYYNTGDIPRWVDCVFDGELLTCQYDWYGELSNGFWNSVFGKKGCKRSTETLDDGDDDEESYVPNYGYIAKDGDIWIYTGITSVNDDASNIGFLMVNQRTGEAHTFQVAGADENSAMAAAEGEVQEKGYHASFPSLVNVDEQPTYIMVLKDASGIVKLYAMVNVESYNIVVTAADLEDCFTAYRKKMKLGGDADVSEETQSSTSEQQESPISEDAWKDVRFTVKKIDTIDIDGNTWIYLTADDGNVYKQKFAENESLIFVKRGDTMAVQAAETADRIYQIREKNKK